MSTHNPASTNDSSLYLESTPSDAEKSFGAQAQAWIQTDHTDLLSETLEAPRTVIPFHQCPLFHSKALIFIPPRFHPTPATPTPKITTPHSTQTLTKMPFTMVCFRPRPYAPLLTRIPVQNLHTQRYDLLWRISTIQKCLVSPLNCVYPTRVTHRAI